MKGMPIFITGTDTGIGKTTVGTLLVEGLVSRGMRIGVAKPVETGAPPGPDGALLPHDACALLRASNIDQQLNEICFHSFVEPVAPSVAFAAAGEVPNVLDWQERVHNVAQRSDFVVVEGAGGIMVPILGEYSFLDFVKDANWPVLVVIGSKLGAINHFALTLEALNKNGVRVIGYVVNELFARSDDFSQHQLAHQSNREQFRLIGSRYGVVELQCLPFLAESAEKESHRKNLSERFLARWEEVFGFEAPRQTYAT